MTVPSRIIGWLLKAAGPPVPCILRANEVTPKPEAGGEELGSTFAHSPSQNDLTLPQSPMCAGICHCVLTPFARSSPFLGPLPGPTGANQGNQVCCWVPWQVQPLMAISQSEEIKRRWALPSQPMGWKVPIVGCGWHVTTVSGNGTVSCCANHLCSPVRWPEHSQGWYLLFASCVQGPPVLSVPKLGHQ